MSIQEEMVFGRVNLRTCYVSSLSLRAHGLELRLQGNSAKCRYACFILYCFCYFEPLAVIMRKSV